MNTRRHPRTLQEAFGPYTSHDLQPMREARGYGVAWWVSICVVSLIGVMAIVHFGQ